MHLNATLSSLEPERGSLSIELLSRCVLDQGAFRDNYELFKIRREEDGKELTNEQRLKSLSGEPRDEWSVNKLLHWCRTGIQFQLENPF